ncbi:hypothetical protein SAMN02745247_03022 [Butyrivibrio hungatei DSM 14810]|uniref:Uncharacterized protein n=1 Tax=Butyrivibrio hungatei DSM 14810 TaxID=1121132 RepID=A0A1M7T548_9FIRM|nr:hypothetical protein [Butyrivibrio hungatei]SHN65834.1 hypothetical protein SAMN02745247_03022 [Butyrivibrio hungatei DSM 14810]
MKAKKWLVGWLVIVISVLSYTGYWVYKVDPFFHYHKPLMNTYYYVLNGYNERNVNDGISKHFDYDVIVTGTSMTENFRTTEVDELFKCKSIKVPFEGGTYKEINDNVERALQHNKNIKLVIRGLDVFEGYIIASPDSMRTDLGEFPSYLYDDNPFNDVHYLLNRNVVFSRVYQMEIDRDKADFEAGVTSFDEYARWHEDYQYGRKTVAPNGIEVIVCDENIQLSAEEKSTIKANVDKNLISVAEKNPNVDFYYFYAPYSIMFWNDLNNTGELQKNLQMQEYVAELLLPYENIHLFSFFGCTGVITNLNNYKDYYHYAGWVNSSILKWMHDGDYQLTNDNYKDVFRKLNDFYSSFDYKSVENQEDYIDDYYAEEVLNENY